MLQSLGQAFESFAEESSIHGASFIAGKNRTKSTRVYFALALVCSLVFLGLYVHEANDKWQTDPNIITKINERYISEIPFPAVTVCSPLFARDQLANYRKFYDNYYRNSKFADYMTSTEANYLMANLQATSSPYLSSHFLKFVPNRTHTRIVKLLNESFLNTDEILMGCSYKNTIEPCGKTFNRILTNHGFCYSFNMQGFNAIFNKHEISEDFQSYKRKEIRQSPLFKTIKEYNNKTFDDDFIEKWTLENGYQTDHHIDKIPVAAQRNVVTRFGFFLNKSDAGNIYGGDKSLFFFLHLPNEIPTPLHQMNRLKFGEAATYTLAAKMFRADDLLRKYEPSIRQCYFEGERKLRFFNTYTKALCEYECIANYTLEKCGCVKFSMPRDGNTPICNETMTDCYFKITRDFPKYDFKQKKIMSCGCLKTCIDLKYSIEREDLSSIGVENFKAITWFKNVHEG
jgi:amiloride-sensitive sodium channel